MRTPPLTGGEGGKIHQERGWKRNLVRENVRAIQKRWGGKQVGGVCSFFDIERARRGKDET